MTNDLSTKNAHLYGAFADVSRRLEDLQISQRGIQHTAGGSASLLTSVNWGKGLGQAQAGTGPAGPVPLSMSPPHMGKGSSLAVSGMTHEFPEVTGNIRSLLPASGNPQGAGVPFADMMGFGNVTTLSANPGLGSQAPPLLGTGKGQKGGKGYPAEYGMYGYGYRDMSLLLTQTMSDVLPISA